MPFQEPNPFLRRTDHNSVSVLTGIIENTFALFDWHFQANLVAVMIF